LPVLPPWTIALVYLIGFIARTFWRPTGYSFTGNRNFRQLFTVNWGGWRGQRESSVLDFSFIDRASEAGAPKYMEWYGAFGLMVTLIWLYLEILRLLSKIASRE
jgi:hypothetical protein